MTSNQERKLVKTPDAPPVLYLVTGSDPIHGTPCSWATDDQNVAHERIRDWRSSSLTIYVPVADRERALKLAEAAAVTGRAAVSAAEASMESLKTARARIAELERELDEVRRGLKGHDFLDRWVSEGGRWRSVYRSIGDGHLHAVVILGDPAAENKGTAADHYSLAKELGMKEEDDVESGNGSGREPTPAEKT